MQALEVSTEKSAAANAAWARRPADMVFDDLKDLVGYTEKMKDSSFIRDTPVEYAQVFTHGDSLTPGEDDMLIGYPHEGVAKKAVFNNYSFGEFCKNIGARVGEWRKYPAALAQMPLTWKAQYADRKDVKLLIQSRPGEPDLCRAVNSPTYGRIWNHELSSAVESHIDPSFWGVPKEIAFHTKTGFITANDRKVFVFLVNESNPIFLDGMDKPLFRGMYAWNSEVGDGTCGMAEFLLNGACANRCMIGTSGFRELKIRHTSGAPERWIREAVPQLQKYVNTGTAQVKGLLEASREKTVAKDDKGALSFLKKFGFTEMLAKSALTSARSSDAGADSRSSPFSVWNVMQGLTAEARGIENNDIRVAIEIKAGQLMKAVS